MNIVRTMQVPLDDRWLMTRCSADILALMSAQGQQNLMTQMGQSGHKLSTVAPFANETGQTVGFFFYFLLEYPNFPGFEPAEGE